MARPLPESVASGCALLRSEGYAGSCFIADSSVLLSCGYGEGEGQAGRGAAERAPSLASLAAAEEADEVAGVVGRRDGGGRADNDPPNRRVASRDMEGPAGEAGSNARGAGLQPDGDRRYASHRRRAA